MLWKAFVDGYRRRSSISSCDLEAVRVRESRSEYVIRVLLQVDPEEKGKVIGREGKIARAMRALVSATAAREGKRGVLEID